MGIGKLKWGKVLQGGGARMGQGSLPQHAKQNGTGNYLVGQVRGTHDLA